MASGLEETLAVALGATLEVARVDALSLDMAVVCVVSPQAARPSVAASPRDKTAIDFFTNFPFLTRYMDECTT